MPRLYGDQQRQAAYTMIDNLKKELENLYLNSFDKLQSSGLGEGMIIKLTRIYLLSRDGAINPLATKLSTNDL